MRVISQYGVSFNFDKILLVLDSSSLKYVYEDDEGVLVEFFSSEEAEKAFSTIHEAYSQGIKTCDFRKK